MNDIHTQRQVDAFNLKNASEDLTTASAQRKAINDDSRKISSSYYEKIAYYSAGAFSFSLALVGLVLKDQTIALSNTGFMFPNIYWLYISLFLYLIIISLVLLAIKFDALYSFHLGQYVYDIKKIKYEEANIDFHKSHIGHVVIKDSSSPEEIKTSESNLKFHKENEVINKVKQERFIQLKIYCNMMSEVLVILATAILFLFFIQLMQSVIW